MTLGCFNFDMALHLPSSHSSHHSHSLHSNDSVSAAAAAASIGIHHPHHQSHHHNHSHNLGYSGYPIKYEPCEQQQQQQQSQQNHHQTTTSSSSPATTNSSSSTSSASSSSSAAVAVGTIGTNGMIGSAQDFLLHQQQQLSSSCSTAFDRDFFDTLDSSSRMNQHPQHHHSHSHHQHQRMLSSSGSDSHANHRLSMESPESDESDEDSESLLGINAVRNSLISSDDDMKQRQQHLRALGKSSSLNSNNSNINNLDRKRPYPCKVCPSKFGSKMELEEHQNSHTGQKPFECEVCKSRFNRRSTLWNHKRIHSDAKPFVCTICHMQFKWKNSLKCHKEMHIRKNETPSIDIDSDIRQLTYATAAKRKMLEMDGGCGGDSTAAARSASSIFSAGPSTSSSSSQMNNNNNGSNSNNINLSNESSKNAERKKQKLTKKESSSSIKKEPMETTTSLTSAASATANNDTQQLNLLMNKAFGGHDFDVNNCNNSHNNYQGLMSNQAMRKLTFGNLGGDFIDTHQSNNFGADFGLDHSNFDLMNNPLWMQFWNSEQVESMNQLDFHSNRNQNSSSLFGGMDDPSKVLANGIFDLKDTLGLQSPNGNATSNNAAANHINMLLPKPGMLNIDLNSFNSLHDSVNQRNHSNLPGINHLGAGTTFPDYSSAHDNTSLASQFHLGQNQSTASSSSTPSSNGHQPNGHLNSELTYHQPLDHALLLNTNHPNDYMLPLEYMTPTGAHSTSIYPSHDLPLSALTSSHDPLEHSPHSSSSRAAMFYHSNLTSEHHPGCISSQIPNVASAAVAAAAAVQQMR